MGHFQRWLKGLVFAVIGIMVAFLGLISSAVLIIIYPGYANISALLLIALTVFGLVVYLQGRYIMEEEKPRGRFRVEQ